MSTHGRSLRSVLSWGTLLLAAPTVAAVVTIVALTTLLHRASAAVERSTEGLRAAEEGQIDLLLHAQATSPIARRNLAGDLQRRLSEAASYVGTDDERLLLEEARSRVQEYIVASRSGRPEGEVGALHAAAFTALEDLVQVNLTQARREVSRAARVDYVANLGGLLLALLVLAVTGFYLYWVRGPLLDPLLELEGAMDRFARGEQAARSPVTGPRELRAMAERFNGMAAEIERQRARQREFLAGVAHDLRTPVGALALSTEAALSDTARSPDPRMRRALESNVRQLRNLDRMISDFVNVAAIEAGQLELRLELHDLRDVLFSTAESFERMSSRHEMVLSVPPQPVEVRMDALRMEQVIGNLISNAIKYSPEGGDIELRLERRGNELMLAVADRGLGISPDARERLFEPFTREGSRAMIPGAGLGLYVVRRIVAAHGGRIEVDSAPGAGSTFRVYLPVARGPSTGVPVTDA